MTQHLSAQLDTRLPLSAYTAQMIGGAPPAFAPSLVDPALPATGEWERQRMLRIHEALDQDEDVFGLDDDDDDYGGRGQRRRRRRKRRLKKRIRRRRRRGKGTVRASKRLARVMDRMGDEFDDDYGDEFDDDYGDEFDDDYGDDDDDDYGDEDDDDYGDEDDDDYGDEDDDDYGDEDDDDYAFDLDEYGDDDDDDYGGRRGRRRRRKKRRRRKIRKWRAARKGSRKARRLRKAIVRLSRKLGLPLPPDMRPRMVQPGARRLYKPGAYIKPAPVPGAPSRLTPAYGPVRAGPAPGRRRGRPGRFRRRMRRARRQARRRGRRDVRRSRRGRRRGRGGRRAPAPVATSRTAAPILAPMVGADVKNLGAASIAFPFQALVAVLAVGAAGALVAPTVQRAWDNFRL